MFVCSVLFARSFGYIIVRSAGLMSLAHSKLQPLFLSQSLPLKFLSFHRKSTLDQNADLSFADSMHALRTLLQLCMRDSCLLVPLHRDLIIVFASILLTAFSIAETRMSGKETKIRVDAAVRAVLLNWKNALPQSLEHHSLSFCSLAMEHFGAILQTSTDRTA